MEENKDAVLVEFQEISHTTLDPIDVTPPPEQNSIEHRTVLDLSFDITMTPRENIVDTPKDTEKIKRRREIAEKIAHIIVEIITAILSLSFVACLLVGAALRTNYASTTYLAMFLVTLAFPSSFGYYLYLPINRFWMYTPRLPCTIIATVIAMIFLIIQISFQIAYAAGVTFDMTSTKVLEDFGIIQ
jgi:hypothetical protein